MKLKVEDLKKNIYKLCIKNKNKDKIDYVMYGIITEQYLDLFNSG
ncbi:hypothetical protein Q5M85_22010 [Paraclostridium bifermentans]|nr:hypothetical protein [Paraclostridium bifermentans]